jgi:hypothetical protein
LKKAQHNIVQTGMKQLLVLLMIPLVALSAKDTTPGPMRRAIAQLEAAKTAAEPLVFLRTARKELVSAKSNKEGERKDAIAYVDEAIAYATTGDKKTMQEKITKAISNAKSGIARSK